jgi:hypothetical protein
MRKADLARALRQRQRVLGRVSSETINTLSDDAVIDAYITCSCCGEEQVTQEQLRVAIFWAKNVDDFFNLCNQLGKEHRE